MMYNSVNWDSVDAVLRVNFFNSSDGVVMDFAGNLVRPINSEYEVNQKESYDGCMKFIAAINSKKDAVWEMSTSTKLVFRFELDRQTYGSIRLRLRYGPQSGSPSQYRGIWCELIRQGFRPSLGDFS
jgi:hypothetical protein